MGLFSVFNTAASGMSAESVRLNTVSSNLANANTVSSSAEKTYRARSPIFSAELDQAYYRGPNGFRNPDSIPVHVDGIVESKKPLNMIYNPDHPMANEEGYIFKPNVNTMEEMANMISASQSYQSNVQVADVSKQMLLKTLQMGK